MVVRALLLGALLASTVLGGTATAAPSRNGAFTETTTAPTITKQPVSSTVNEGKSATFEAAASGKPAPTVQWELSTNGGSSWSAIAGATATKYTIASVSGSENGYEFRAKFTNVAGTATTAAATLTVDTLPVVTKQPANTTVEEGQNATFEASASGRPAPTVQWQTSSNGGSTWNNVSGATSETLTIVGTKTTLSGHLYRAVFANAAGKTNSEAATLTVQKAPAVTKQPSNVAVNEGQSASFEATASGFPAPTVQWELSTNGGGSWSPIAGATSGTYTIASVSGTENGYEFRARFANGAGSATSGAATLTVDTLPVVTKQPANTTVEEGQNATFEASASGRPAPTVQWQASANGTTWSNINGATSETLTIVGAKTSLSGHQYRAIFTNVVGKATSEAATLTVQKRPEVSTQPTSQTVIEGHSVTFEAAASGSPTPTVQWEVSSNSGTSWSAISGATASKYTIASVSPSEDGYEFRATFANAAGTATTNAATLTVDEAPVVTQQPVNVTVKVGEPASFEAAASGKPPPTMQWELSTNGGSTWSPISGATSNALKIAETKLSENGYKFRATFINVAGKVRSEQATLTVEKAPEVTKQPTSQTAIEGHSATFEAAASGSPTPAVQWEVSSNAGASWSAISGATSSKYTITAVSATEDGYEFRATFTNPAGTATTTAATLTVYIPPRVTIDPLSTTVKVGEPVEFETAATGKPPPTVQWELSTNGGTTWSPISGATTDTLKIAEAKLAENGDKYRATFTNAAGKATTTAATLTVATTKYSAVAWGQNTVRQLGDGTAEAMSPVPRPVSGLTFITAIAAGGQHSLALLADGTVKAWGSNEFGQLGNGSEVTPLTPVTVSGLSGVRAIAAGAVHSLALLSNGTVMAWGNNESGQLGTGTTTESQVPVAVKGLKGVRAIAAGGNDSFALLSTGTVMAWGENENGELGSGSTALHSTTPVAVKGLTNVQAIAAGGNFALALLNGGAVEAWGSNQYGQLANSSAEEESNVPVPVIGLPSGVEAITAGSRHALALISGGTVWAWGEDNQGELGNGVFKIKQETPAAIGGLSGVSAITAGGQDSAALLASGSLMAWGIDNWGQLGNGTTGSPSAVPVNVEGVRKGAAVAAGGFHLVAYGEPIPVVTKLSPTRGPLTGGNTVTISGDNFEAPASVKFGAAEATAVKVNSPTSITATAPAGSGTVDVTVTTPSGTSPPVNADRFTYVPPPQVTKLVPLTGSVQGGTEVTITGANFTGVTEVKFGSLAAKSYIVNSTTTITAITAAEPVGSVQVNVSTEFGTSAFTSNDIYKFAPEITSLAPNAGPIAGGTSVTIKGFGFAPGATKVKFGSTASQSVTCASSTECTALAPAHAAGTVEVSTIVNKVRSLKTPATADFTYS